MNKTIKKVISIALVAAVVFASAPLSGFIGIELPDLFSVSAKAAESGICGDDLTWTFNESTGVLTIGGTGEMWNYSLSPWDSYAEQLKTVIINDGVTTIGEKAFAFCDNLKNITIGKNVKTIGFAAFSGCDNIASVSMPDGLISIESHAFFDCDGLTSVNFSNSIKIIGDHAFEHCDILNSAHIPNSVEAIEGSAFRDCISLKNVTLSNNINIISISTFNGCISLENIIIPQDVAIIDNYSFNKCYSLSNITISKSVTSVGVSAFGLCSALSDVYYSGTEAEWKEISFDEYNEDLTDSNIHFNSHLSTEDPLVTRVKQYTLDQSDDIYMKLNKFAQTKDTSDYNDLINAYNLYGNSQKEMHDFQMLTNNELYVAWQFKETVNKPFAKYGLGAARLIYSGDVWQYSADNNPYEQRYTTALRKFIEDSAPKTELTLYQQLWYNFLSSEEISGKLTSSALNVNDILSEVMQVENAEALNSFITDLKLDKIISSETVMETNSIISKFSPLVDIFSLGLTIKNLSTEKLIELFNIIAKLDAYYEYSEMFAKVANAENLPDGLRNAAHTVSLQIDGQISKIATDLKKGIEAETTKTAMGISIDIVAMLTSEIVGTVAAGINIGVLMSNAFLGFTDTLNSVCYIEAYAMISEFYSNELLRLKNSFNADPTLEKAQEFKREYEFLRSMRIAGEKAYLEMSKHENMYNSLFKMAIIVLCNYYKKAVFVKESVESLERLAFTMQNDEFTEMPYIEEISDKITIACPVNVYIYDKDNNLVCAVENNEVLYYSETSDTLPKVIVVEETKHIFIPENSDFYIRVSAYDNGTVTYSVDSFGDEDYSKVSYYDIPISTGSVCVINKDNSGNYDSITKDGRIIAESERYSGNENSVPSVNINATINGLGYVSVGNKYAKGDLVGLIATPKEGAEFLYWIINGEKVAESAEVYFIAKESIDTVAVFSCKDKISINSPTNYTVNYGDTLILSAQLSNADTSANIIWVADSDAVILTPSEDGKTCAVKPLKSGNVEIKAYLADENGNVIFDNDETNAESSIKITTKVGLFQKIISFFKNLFGINRIIY